MGVASGIRSVSAGAGADVLRPRQLVSGAFEDAVQLGRGAERVVGEVGDALAGGERQVQPVCHPLSGGSVE